MFMFAKALKSILPKTDKGPPEENKQKDVMCWENRLNKCLCFLFLKVVLH